MHQKIMMSIDEIKKAIKNRTVVEMKWDPEWWGILTCLSDDETGVYHLRYGAPGWRSFSKIEDVILPEEDK